MPAIGLHDNVTYLTKVTYSTGLNKMNLTIRIEDNTLNLDALIYSLDQQWRCYVTGNVFIICALRAERA